MADKITRQIGFETARKVFADLGDEAMVAFFDKQLAQIEKQKATPRKKTARQIENDAYKEIILNTMKENTEYTIDDMLMYFGLPLSFSSQRVSALLYQLGENGSHQIKKTDRKGKAYYKLSSCID